MKVSCVFIRVINKPEYEPTTRRWLASYQQFEAAHPHELVVINRCADSPDALFDGVATRYLRYDLGGWDCGAWQFAAKTIDTDLLVCMNTSTYICGPGWLKRFVDAVETHGDGLYGPLTSFEIVPHVRTPCFVFQPHVIKGYPREVQTRDDTYRFESMGWPDGTPNITQWVRSKGYKTPLVTWDGVYDQPDWRKPPNIFRRGDQSNLIIRDRHCDAYEVSDAAGKALLEKLANGV